jgi:tetratricopeptide (TPR) repeat protein
VEPTSQSIEGAVEAVNSGRAYLIIVDDTVEEPAVSALRQLISDPICCCTPILSFLLDQHLGDAAALARMSPLEIVGKPLTPSKFLPAFKSLVQKWETWQFLTLRMGIQQYLRAGLEPGQVAMKKLVGLENILPIVAQNLSIMFRNRGELVDAEKILLHALKKNPKDLGLMLSLGDLYMNCSMPKMALRLFQGARTIYGDTMAVYPDLVQAALSLGRFQEAAEFLATMHRRDFRTSETLDFLTRVNFAEGRLAEAEKILANKTGLYRKIQATWLAAASESIMEAS